MTQNNSSILIDNADNESIFSHLPLAVRMRPQIARELLGQEHLFVPNSPLNQLITPARGKNSPQPTTSSIILWGPAGVGKTTIASLVSKNNNRHFEELSAVNAGVADVRKICETARHRLVDTGQETVLFIDEIHRFSKSQQDALLPGVENRFIILIGATTENPYFSIINPLLSRSIMLTLKPLTEDNIAKLIDRAVKSPNGLKGLVKINSAAKKYLVRLSGNDARKALTILEAAASMAMNSKLKEKVITEDIIGNAIDQALVKYDRQGDSHYDVASAFIKSLRGSDVDGALHYMARMIVAGEDPRFIARRIMIAASEEVSVANPQALTTAVAAAQAVQLIGMPEARLILAQAVVEVCLSPKSNATYLAIDHAIADVEAGLAGSVPVHLRDSHYSGAKKIGHGNDYIYAHDEPGSIARQQYLPDTVKDKKYYKPGENGREKELKKRNDIIRKYLGKE